MFLSLLPDVRVLPSLHAFEMLFLVKGEPIPVVTICLLASDKAIAESYLIWAVENHL